MERNVEKIIEQIKNKIRNGSNSVIENIEIKQGEYGGKVAVSGRGNKTIYYIPMEYFDDLKRTLDEEIQLRDIKFRDETDQAFAIANSGLKKVSKSDLENFEQKQETTEEIKERAKREARQRQARRNIDIRNKRIEQRKIKYQKFNKAKDKHGKKIRNVILVLGLGTAAITGAVQGISTMNANAAETNKLNEQYSNLSTEQINEISINNIKDQISEGTNVNKDEIKIYDANRTSSGTEVTVKIGDEYYTHTNDYEDFIDLNDDSLDRNISTLILEIKEADTKQKSIEALKHSINMKEKSKMKIEQNGNTKRLTTEEKGDEER